MSRDVKLITIEEGAAVAFQSSDEPTKMLLVFDDNQANTRLVLKVPLHWHTGLGMSLLSVDGARVYVKLSWPRPKKAKKKAKKKP